MKVKVIDKENKYYGMEFDGHCIYYDIDHTGHSPDLYNIHTPDGDMQILSTKIDEQHYWNQRRDEEIKKLGANIGDTVIIKRMGSCSCYHDFDTAVPHIITEIDSTGHVDFDNGRAKCFRPDIEVVLPNTKKLMPPDSHILA